MTSFVALLRAINVGGTGILPMKDLASLCIGLGLEDVRTYIQTGNVVFRSSLSASKISTSLEKALAEKMGKPVDVMIRTGAELRSVLESNPFPQGKPAQIAVMFLARPVPKGALESLVIPGSEEVQSAGQEIYIHYPEGMGRSKLKLPPDVIGTARNLNTVAKLVAMAAE